jgi:hypothetical protein
MSRPLRALLLALFLTALLPTSSFAARADRDGDGLPDRWERRHHARSAGADLDRDGLTNLAEYRSGTNPRKRDSDRDRLPDGREDPDRDRLDNRAEARYAWDPRKADTDRDGIRDGAENAGLLSAVDGLQVTLRLAVRGATVTGALADPEVVTCRVVPAGGTPAAGGTGAGGGETPQTEDVPEEPVVWEAAWGEMPVNLDGDDDGGDVGGATATAAQADGGDDADDAGEPAPASAPDGDEAADDAQAEAQAEGRGSGCSTFLKAGAIVHQAVLQTAPDGRRVTRLDLVRTG